MRSALDRTIAINWLRSKGLLPADPSKCYRADIDSRKTFLAYLELRRTEIFEAAYARDRRGYTQIPTEDYFTFCGIVADELADLHELLGIDAAALTLPELKALNGDLTYV